MMTSCNIWITAPENQKSNITHSMFKLAGTGLFCGTGAMSFEGAGVIFTIRESMKNRHQLPKLITSTFVFMGILYLYFSFSAYFAYGNEQIQNIAFLQFDSTWPIMNKVGILFVAVLIIFVPLYNISNAEYLEYYGPI